MTTRKRDNQDQSSDEPYDESRRTFLKITMAASAVLAFGGIGTLLKSITNPSPASTNQASFAKVRIANLSDLQPNKPIFFNYPLDTESNILVKLGQKADAGVGPDGDIVAFSQLCQHLGCPYAFIPAGSSPVCDPSFKASGPMGYCCCHGGQYDYLHGGRVIGGPPPRSVPQVILSVDSSGDIFAVGMSSPAIYGHNAGSDYVSSDLQGGSPVV